MCGEGNASYERVDKNTEHLSRQHVVGAVLGVGILYGSAEDVHVIVVGRDELRKATLVLVEDLLLALLCMLVKHRTEEDLADLVVAGNAEV